LKNQLIKSLVKVFRPKRLNLGEEKRFLILSTTGLGDTLWGTPAIRALRQCFPTSYIGVITSPVGKACLQHNRRIDELFVVENPVFFSLFPLYWKLKKRRITHVLNFHTSQRPILPLASILGAAEIIGTHGINKGLDFLLTHALDHDSFHEIQRRLDIVSQVGAQTLDSSMELFLSQEDEKIADSFLADQHIPSYFPLIALHPGAKDGFKQWPVSHFVELGNRLVRNVGCRVIVTGTPGEKSLVESIASQIEGAIAATNLPLLAAAALIKKMDLLISNDTGPMHVAFAMKTPTIGLFTPTDPKLCGPYFVENAMSIVKSRTCSPCLKKKCREPFCLMQIGVQEVYDAAMNVYLKYPALKSRVSAGAQIIQ
jgi:ADP-heptose:LPS heptosyltransferase